MKIKFFFLSLVAVVATFTMTSCGGSGLSKMFAKKWQLESIKSKAIDDQLAMLKAQMDTAKDSMTKASLQSSLTMMNGMLEGMKKTTLEYRLDGTYETTVYMMGQSQTVKGKWSLADEGKKVIVTDDKQKSDTLNILDMSADKMTVSAPDGRGSTVTITYKSM